MATLSSPSLSSGKSGAREALLRVSVRSVKGKKGKVVGVLRGDSHDYFIHPSVLNLCCMALLGSRHSSHRRRGRGLLSSVSGLWQSRPLSIQALHAEGLLHADHLFRKNK